MFGLFDPNSISRENRTIDFVEPTGARHEVSLRSSAMIKRVSACVQDQATRKLTAVRLKPTKDGKVTLASAGIANYEGAIIETTDGPVIRVSRIKAFGLEMKHKGQYRVKFLDKVDAFEKPMLAAVEGYIENDQIVCYRAAVQPIPAPAPDSRPAAE